LQIGERRGLEAMPEQPNYSGKRHGAIRLTGIKPYCVIQAVRDQEISIAVVIEIAWQNGEGSGGAGLR